MVLTNHQNGQFLPLDENAAIGFYRNEHIAAFQQHKPANHQTFVSTPSYYGFVHPSSFPAAAAPPPPLQRLPVAAAVEQMIVDSTAMVVATTQKRKLGQEGMPVWPKRSRFEPIPTPVYRPPVVLGAGRDLDEQLFHQIHGSDLFYQQRGTADDI